MSSTLDESNHPCSGFDELSFYNPYSSHQLSIDEYSLQSYPSTIDLHPAYPSTVDLHTNDNIVVEATETPIPTVTEAEETTRRKKIVDDFIPIFKYTYSFMLLLFSVILVITAIFTKQTKVTKSGLPTTVAFLIFWFLLAWLSVLEGQLGTLVGLQPIDKKLYTESHRIALMNTSLAHNGDNMERYIIGRQFLVILIVFCTNLMGSAISDASVLGLPYIINEIFISEGVAMIIVTIMIGMLISQVIAADCMLDFLNHYFMLFTTYVALAVEKCGILHCIYLVNIFFSQITGKQIDAKEPKRSKLSCLLFWFKILMSIIVVGFSFAVTIAALFQGKTKMWEGVPNYVSVIIFLILMMIVGIMEGMQIALFAVINLPKIELKKFPVCYVNCKLAFRNKNLKALLIGRQICVTCCMFIVARITSVNVDTNNADTENIFGVNDSIQNFFNTGLLGAVITTVFGSLAWRMIAAAFPIGYLSNPLIYIIIQLCLMLEKTGVCSAAWLLGRQTKKLAGFKPDYVYLGGEVARIFTESIQKSKRSQSILPV